MAEPALPARPADAGAAAILTASGVSRTFGPGPAAVHALRDVSFSVPKGRLVVVYGRSGSGKTTLLNIVGGLGAPTGGTVRVAGHDLAAMTERERRMMRRATVAFIFQSFGLIPMLSAAENVGIPLRIAGPRARPARSGPASCSASSASTSTPGSAPASCRAASSSGLPSPAPCPAAPSC